MVYIRSLELGWTGISAQCLSLRCRVIGEDKMSREIGEDMSRDIGEDKMSSESVELPTRMRMSLILDAMFGRSRSRKSLY